MMLQHFVDTTRVDTEAGGDVVLILPVPMAMPNFNRVIERKAVSLVVLIHRIKLSLCEL